MRSVQDLDITTGRAEFKTGALVIGLADENVRYRIGPDRDVRHSQSVVTGPRKNRPRGKKIRIRTEFQIF